MKDWQRARRDLLKRLGLGAACLPLLRATRSWAAPVAPKRLMVIQMNQGYRQMWWKPATGSLSTQTLPDSSAPLEPHKAEMIFLPDLSNPGGGAGHGAYGAMFHGLGAAPVGGTYKEPNGMTLDQQVATRLPSVPAGKRSLHVSVQLERAPRATPVAAGSRCFWSGAGQPINPVGDPSLVYQEIFAGSGAVDTTAARRLMVRKKSILDYVGSNLEEFRTRAGMADREAIGAHLQSIRDLELRLAAGAVVSTCGTSSTSMVDLNDRTKYPLILDAHLRLMVAALKCGVTGVTTLQTSDAQGKNVDCAFVPGVPARGTGYLTPYRTWDDCAHNPLMGGVDHKRMVDKWFIGRFAELIAQLKAVPEAGGTLLDNTIVLIGNPIQDGGNHNAQKAPWMLAGNCGGYLATGNCLPSADQPISSVMAGICEALGLEHPYGPVLAGLKKV